MDENHIAERWPDEVKRCLVCCRHLQRFWGASGNFWQNLWTKLYVMFEGHNEALFYMGKEMERHVDSSMNRLISDRFDGI